MEKLYHQFVPNISKLSILKGTRITIGEFSEVEDAVLIDSGVNPDSSIIIGSRCKIKRFTTIKSYNGFVKIGNRVSVGEYTILAGHGGLVIGDATIIAGHCYISAANHIYSKGNNIRFQGEKIKSVHIGSDVWVGGSVNILAGVSIGDGSIIGAGSIVTRDMPPNSICYGNPCNVVKERKSWRLNDDI